jgi:Tol biopolymer transport system component
VIGLVLKAPAWAGRVWGALVIVVWFSSAPAWAQISLVGTTNGLLPNGHTDGLAVSSDGRYVAMVSWASSLTPGDAGYDPDVFVKDRQTGAITRVTLTEAGVEAGGYINQRIAMSGDGRYVVFTATRPFVASDTNVCETIDNTAFPGCDDVYLRDLVSGTIRRISVSSLGGDTNEASLGSGISADGHIVLFSSKANNIVPGSAGPGVPLYLRDWTTGTTTRVATQGTVANAVLGASAMSADARTIVFSAGQSLLGAEGDALPCYAQYWAPCHRLYVFTPEDGKTVRFTPALTILPGTQNVDLSLGGLSADGRFLVFVASSDIASRTAEQAIYVYDRVADKTTRVRAEATAGVSSLAISDDGGVVAVCGVRPRDGHGEYVMTLWGASGAEFVPSVDPAQPRASCNRSAVLSGNGRWLIFDSADRALLPGQTSTGAFTYAYDRDPDGDGLPSTWEVAYGLNPANAADAAADPDGDGLSNLEEYRAGSHPAGRMTRYFAEGASGSFFSTALHLFNPEPTAATALLTFSGTAGTTSTAIVRLEPKGLAVVKPMIEPWATPWDAQTAVVPDAAFSTTVESNHLLALERDMTWGNADAPAYGSHAETAIDAPRASWYFAEGATRPYSLYYLLQNPNAAAATVAVTYLQPAPRAPIARTYTVPARSRLTIDVNGEPGLAGAEVSATVTADLPILAERAMYLSTKEEFFAAGHDGVAIGEPATEWFIAEGATGFFSLYYTIANPNASPAALVVRYLLPGGVTFEVPHEVAGNARLTIDVAGDDPRLRSAEVSAVIRSTNGIPVVAERVMWWPRGAPYEATLTAGATAAGRRWAVASAAVQGGENPIDSYVLVANPTGQDGTFTATLTGTSAAGVTLQCSRTFELLAHSRKTIHVLDVCRGVALPSGLNSFAGTIESSGPDIVAERVTYQSVPGKLWTSGAAAALTRLPDVP